MSITSGLSNVHKQSIENSSAQTRSDTLLAVKNGLGKRYFDLLSYNIDKILQVDTITGATESNGTVRGRAIQLATVLKRKGILENDIIVISSKSNAEETIVILASLFIGAILAPIDMETTFDDWVSVISKIRPKIAFCEIRAVSQMDRVFNTLNLQREIIVFGNERCGDKELFSSLFTLKEDPKFKPTHVENSKKKIAFILPTAGTMGSLKLVCLSHYNIFSRVLTFLEILGYSQKILSYYTMDNQLQCLAVCASFENKITRILPGSFNERLCCKFVQDLQIDALILGTNQTRILCRNIAVKDYDLSSLYIIIVGGTYTTKEDMNYFRSIITNIKFIQIYGSQEMGCVAATPLDDYKEAAKRLTSCGKLLNNIKVKIVDIETTEKLPVGVLGQIYFSGEGLMLGYFKRSYHAPIMDGNYLITRDVGRFDKEGWLYLDGRLEDVVTIKIEGQLKLRFTCRDLECIVNRFPLVKESVFIYNDNELVCCIQKRGDTMIPNEKIKQFVEECLPREKRPTRIVFYEEFPRTPIGKIKRNVLKSDLFDYQIDVIQSLADLRI